MGKRVLLLVAVLALAVLVNISVVMLVRHKREQAKRALKFLPPRTVSTAPKPATKKRPRRRTAEPRRKRVNENKGGEEDELLTN